MAIPYLSNFGYADIVNTAILLGVGRLVFYARRLDRILYQHDIMWSTYARDHKIGNGATAPAH